jgi:hypothetical protein
MSLFRPVVAPLLVLTLLIAACGSAATPASSGAPTTPTETTQPNQPDETEPTDTEPTPGTALSACELVAPEDIEAALGFEASTVDEGTLSDEPTSLDPNRQECRYDQEDWGGLVVDVKPTDGLNTFDAVESAFGEDAESIDGIGDGALWFEDNDRGYFLKGSVMVLLQFTYLVEGELDSFRDPTVALGEAAVNKI